MKSSYQSWLASVSLSLLTCLVSDHSAAGAETVSARTLPNTTPRSGSIISNQIPEIEIPSSVFVSDFSNPSARDPFFPNAIYTQSKKKIDDAPQPTPTQLDDGVLKSLKLTGMGGVGDRRWAMINNVTIYLGEDAKFNVGGKLLTVECLKLDEKSVTIGVKGKPIRRQIDLE
ncbi:hypothetical protein GC207_03260 [bacterium]|nr:hypothetical protein [bacterium]